MNLSFAGIISDVQHRVSKAGKGWALFTIEDYGDSNEFRIFGEEYLKMKHFLVPNSFYLYVLPFNLAGPIKKGVRRTAFEIYRNETLALILWTNSVKK